MNQQQNKHGNNENYKRNRIPAKLLSTEFVAIDEDGTIKATFNNEEDTNKLKQTTNYNWYMIKTYKLNNKTITTKQKED